MKSALVPSSTNLSDSPTECPVWVTPEFRAIQAVPRSWLSGAAQGIVAVVPGISGVTNRSVWVCDARTAVMSGADVTLNLGSQCRMAFFGRLYVMCMSEN